MKIIIQLPLYNWD